MAARIKKDDVVVVIAGDQKGARGKVLWVIPEKQRVLVEGVNMIYRHVRKSRQNPTGGRVRKEAPIHISNVMPLDPKTDRPARVRFAVHREPDGTWRKLRVTAGRRASGAELGVVARHAPAEKGGKR